MRTESFLDHEVILLLAKYGERSVVAALAAKLGLSPEDLEERLKRLNNIKPRVPSRKPIDLARVVDEIASKSPEKSRSLGLLLVQFQNRTFLPELKDVKRFFDRHSDILGHVKSRVEAAPKLFRLLGTLSTSELTNLADSHRHEKDSSLGIISDEILRRHK